MKPNQFVIGVFSVAAIASSTIAVNPAQACIFGSKSITNAVEQPPQIDPTTTNNGNSNWAGFALLSGLLAVGGVYWSKRSRQSTVIDHAEYAALEMLDTPTVEHEDRELISSRK